MQRGVDHVVLMSRVLASSDFDSRRGGRPWARRAPADRSARSAAASCGGNDQRRRRATLVRGGDRLGCNRRARQRRRTAAAAAGAAAGGFGGRQRRGRPPHRRRQCRLFSAALWAMRKSRIMACSSRTSRTISADAGADLLGRRLRRRGVAELVLGEQEAADHAGQRRRHTSRTSLPRKRRARAHLCAGDAILGLHALKPRVHGTRSPPATIRFSNDRLNFKHVFWAADGREKGIFAAIPGFFRRRRRFKPAGQGRRSPSG